MPYTAEKVYTPENFYFATKAKNRLPTLYFRTDHGSGRLRQEHGDGPKVQEIRKHTSHAFFDSEEKVKAFAKALKTRYPDKRSMTRQNFRDLRREYHGINRPVQNYSHYEATFDGHDSARICTVRHKSGGIVVSAGESETLRAQAASIFASTARDEATWQRERALREAGEGDS